MRTKTCFVISLLVTCSLLSSCAAPPRAIVRTVVDMETEIKADKVIIVSDAGKKYGKPFGKSFVNELIRLTQDSEAEASVMTYIEFIRSPYNNPKEKSSFSDTLFVFVTGHISKSSQYGTYRVKYLMDVKYLDQDPLISKEIILDIATNQIFDQKPQGGCELAQTVFEELQTRNII